VLSVQEALRRHHVLLCRSLFHFKTWDNCLCAFLTDTLLIDYQFTFSLSQEDDRYYTAINFVATPEEVNFLLSL